MKKIGIDEVIVALEEIVKECRKHSFHECENCMYERFCEETDRTYPENWNLEEIVYCMEKGEKE